MNQKIDNIIKFVKNEISNNDEDMNEIEEIASDIYMNMDALYNTKHGKASIELVIIAGEYGIEWDKKKAQLDKIIYENDEEYENLNKHTIEDILMNHTKIPRYLCGTDTDYENLYKLISESRGPMELAVAFLEDKNIDIAI